MYVPTYCSNNVGILRIPVFVQLCVRPVCIARSCQRGRGTSPLGVIPWVLVTDVSPPQEDCNRRTDVKLFPSAVASPKPFGYRRPAQLQAYVLREFARSKFRPLVSPPHGRTECARLV